MSRFLYFCLLLMSNGSLMAQPSYELEQSFPLKRADAFTVDQFSNIYVIRGSELLKLDKTGKEIHSFSNPILGDMYQVDVQNPMNPYIFYRHANQLVVVDNRLNQSSQLNFADYGFFDVQFISFADQENVWFYDQATDKLYRFNIRQRRRTNQSLNITQIIGEENVPAGMVSTVDNLYLNVPDKGIFVFDAVGAYKMTIPLKDVVAMDVRGNRLVAAPNAGAVQVYNLATGRLEPVIISESQVKDLKLKSNRLYLFAGSKLKIYRPIASKSGK